MRRAPMKYNGILIWVLMIWISACSSPPNSLTAIRGKFGPTTNGLLYSPRTMSQLCHIVDSLNLKHRVCTLHPIYRSIYQGRAHHIRLQKGDLQQARKFLEQGISFKTFQARFPESEIHKDLLVIRYEDESDEQPITVYNNITFPGEEEYFLYVKGSPQTQKLKPGQWIMERKPNPTYDALCLEAFYFPDGLERKILPTSYASLIQYADCLIDTTTQVYLKPNKDGERTARNSTSGKTQLALLAYVHKQTHRPSNDYYDAKLTEAEQAARWRAYREWDSLRLEKVDQLAKMPRFRELLNQAVKDTTNLGATDDEFEEYVARYYSAKKALEFKRNRIVVGECSQDARPRRHALSIAQLSAETVNWETFLRAHLDIMNDRFERASDGSYAWAARKTYLRELEELDINVHDLMLGISLRIDQANRNHYFGSLSRVGRALAETRQPHELEQRLLNIIADSKLDTYNRVLAYYLFLNYNRQLKDRTAQQQNVDKLNAAVQKLPPYLIARAVIKE